MRRLSVNALSFLTALFVLASCQKEAASSFSAVPATAIQSKSVKELPAVKTNTFKGPR